MVARLLAKLLHMVGMLTTDKVVEVQRTDLVGEFVGHTGPKTQKKVSWKFSRFPVWFFGTPCEKIVKVGLTVQFLFAQT